MIITLAATALAVVQLASTGSKPEYDVVYLRNFDPLNAGLVARSVNNDGTVSAMDFHAGNLSGVWNKNQTLYDDAFQSNRVKLQSNSTGITVSISGGSSPIYGLNNDGGLVGIASWYGSNLGQSPLDPFKPPQNRGTAVPYRLQGSSVQFLNAPTDVRLVPGGPMLRFPMPVNSSGEFAAAGVIGNGDPGSAQYRIVLYVNNQPVELPAGGPNVRHSVAVGLNDSGTLLSYEYAPSGVFGMLRDRDGRTQVLQPLSGGGYANLPRLFGNAGLPERAASSFMDATDYMMFDGQAGSRYKFSYMLGDLSKDNKVVGGAWDQAGYCRAVMWSGNTPAKLPDVEGYDSSMACRIDGKQSIYGVAWRQSKRLGFSPWVIWKNGESYFINDCIDKKAKVSITGVMDVSDNGIILASLGENVSRREFVLLVPRKS